MLRADMVARMRLRQSNLAQNSRQGNILSELGVSEIFDNPVAQDPLLIDLTQLTEQST